MTFSIAIRIRIRVFQDPDPDFLGSGDPDPGEFNFKIRIRDPDPEKMVRIGHTAYMQGNVWCLDVLLFQILRKSVTRDFNACFLGRSIDLEKLELRG